MHEVGRAQLAQSKQGLGSGVNCLVEHILRQPTEREVSWRCLGFVMAGSADSGTAGATMATDYQATFAVWR